jgi:hypothetical protein
MAMTEEYSITRAREQIFDALRFLNPADAERILSEMARDMKKLADKYDRLLEETIL